MVTPLERLPLEILSKISLYLNPKSFVDLGDSAPALEKVLKGEDCCKAYILVSSFMRPVVKHIITFSGKLLAFSRSAVGKSRRYRLCNSYTKAVSDESEFS